MLVHYMSRGVKLEFFCCNEFWNKENLKFSEQKIKNKDGFVYIMYEQPEVKIG